MVLYTAIRFGTYDEIPPLKLNGDNVQNRQFSALDCTISLKFGTEFRYCYIFYYPVSPHHGLVYIITCS